MSTSMRGWSRWPLLVPAAVLIGLLAVTPAQAQQLEAPWAERINEELAPVPFGPGERLEYQVKLGAFTVGESWMRVHGVERVRGHRTYHVSMGIQGGIPLARVDNLLESWIDVETLSSRRFVQDQDEVRTQRFRQFEFFPEERRYERADIDESGELPTDQPLDEIAFVYYVRTLPLEVGETYELDRYFQEDGNPVVVKVVRRDQVEVPAGTFNTIVVQPIIQTRGLFGEGGEAEIHFSDDSRRLLVQLRSRVPVMGSLSLHLRNITPGRSLRPLAFSEAVEEYRGG
ncbi:MAG: DUF3108 domain-containing protein [Gemmatimonadales bacterium]|nr:MAG: DUF3108 domain-containing protein [Gemmatimonadales bacterium]